MPVSSQHPQYKAALTGWQKCRDAFAGDEAIKKGGTTYLPKLTGQTDEEYKAYKQRALFYPITSKTVTALAGMAISKPPVIKMPKELEYLNYEQDGIQVYEILSKTLLENLLIGRIGYLADRTKDGKQVDVLMYCAESIINWVLDDTGKPRMVVLKEESLAQNPDDEFEQVTVCQYKKLFIDKQGFYAVEVYDEDDKLITAAYNPVNQGVPMKGIPFYIVNPYGIGFDVVKAPMNDIVDVNLSHYLTSADLEHGRHFTALPTPVVSGIDASSKLAIGSLTAWVLPSEKAKAYYLEFTGQGLQSLEKALAEKHNQLATLSASLMNNTGNGSEAAETVRLRYLSETASLGSVVRAVEAGINLIVRTVATMMNADTTEVQISIDKNFLDNKLTPQEITTLTTAYLEGTISEETLIFNFRRGDRLAPGTSDQVEIAALRQQKAERDAAAKLASKPGNNNSTGA